MITFRIFSAIGFSSAAVFPNSKAFPEMIYGFSVVPTVHPTSSSSVRTLMPVMYFVIYSSNFAVMYSALGSSSEMPSVTEDALPFSGYRSTSGYRSSSGYSPEDCKVKSAITIHSAKTAVDLAHPLEHH